MSKAYTIITGASSGIGEACAREQAEQWKNLILVARRKDRLDKLKAELQKECGVSVQVYSVDLAEVKNIEAFFKDIAGEDIEALINNAGLALGKSSFED